MAPEPKAEVWFRFWFRLAPLDERTRMALAAASKRSVRRRRARRATAPRQR